ncbi:predicted protein [Chaetoceros tenuissimus]|uniref:Uncharacterized protein n=1 Tax=Chaetoceros tenuissimus TaxID=426638 RepID=A0AAD3HAM1_9STRA|nr:predicted protein [Chaetoceros tenuissimus]
MALEMREVIQTARAAISKTVDIVAKIEKHILPLEKNKLWKDAMFFLKVKDILRNGNITEENVTKVVADALFRLHESRPEVKVVEGLVQAFPDSLKIKNSFSKLPVQEIALKAQHHIWFHKPFNPYILVLASVGAKEDVVERGGLFDKFSKGYGPLLHLYRHIFCEIYIVEYFQLLVVIFNY